MKFKAGDPVEVAGDLNEPGWEGSWWTGVVVKPERKGMVTVKYDEMLEEDGETKLVESVPAARVRPLAEDDSLSMPLGHRRPGDAVDCWHEDGWWEGYVHRVYNDHITVYFPSTDEEYTDIYPPKKPRPDPEAHRVRTGWEWEAATATWRFRPGRSLPGAANLRNVAPAPAAAALAKRRKSAAATTTRSSSYDSDDMPLAKWQGYVPARQQPSAAVVAFENRRKAMDDMTTSNSGDEGGNEQPKLARRRGHAAATPAPAAKEPPAAGKRKGAAGAAASGVAAKAQGQPVVPGSKRQLQPQPPAEQQPQKKQARRAAAQEAAAAPSPPQAAPGPSSKQPAPQAEQEREQRPQPQRQAAPAVGGQLKKKKERGSEAAALLQGDNAPLQGLDKAAGKRRQDVQQQQRQQGQEGQRQQHGAASKRGSPAASKEAAARDEGRAAAKHRAAGVGTDKGRPRRQAPAATQKRAASPRAAGAGGPAVPERRDSGPDGALEAPREAPAPHGTAGAAAVPAAAAAAAAAAPAAKRRRQDSHASAPRPPPAAVAVATSALGRPQPPPAANDGNLPTTFCLDNLPACVDTRALRGGLEALGLQGLKSVHVVSMPLDTGDSAGGYAVLEFGSSAAAAQHRDRLRSLCLLTPTCAVPRPLVLHEPRIRPGEHAWGAPPRVPGHLPTDFRPTQHFAQPSSLEFELALDWRRAAGVAAAAKRALCLEQAAELAARLAEAARTAGGTQPQPQQLPTSLLLPGEEQPGSADERAVAGGSGSSGAAAWPPPTCCVWLAGLPRGVGEQELVEAFSQFGFPQQATLVLEPVTRRPSGHAVLWMESPQRAAALVQNLRDMMFMLGGTPRPVDASLAVPGPPRGSQSTYDRALRAVLGADDNSALAGGVRFLEVSDELALQPGAKPEERAAVALRRMLHAHREEQAELKAEKQRRFAELDEQQQRRLGDERAKLGRLAALQLAPGPDGKPLLSYLMQRHGIPCKPCKDKDAAAPATRGGGVQSVADLRGLPLATGGLRGTSTCAIA